MDGDSSERAGQSQLKIIWKGFIILDATRNSCDSWKEVKIITLTGVWKKLIATFMDDFVGFKTSVKEATADVLEIAKELELEVEPEDVTELLQSHDEAWMKQE